MFSSIKWFSSPSFGSNWNFLILSRDWDSFHFVLLPRDKPWSTGCSADKQTSVRKMVWRTNWIFMFRSLVLRSTCIRKQTQSTKTLKCIFAVYLCISLQFTAHEFAVCSHSYGQSVSEPMAHILNKGSLCCDRCFNQTQSENDPSW